MSFQIERLKSWLVTHYREVIAVDQLDLVLRLTMIYLLIKPIGVWYLKVPITLLCIWGLVSPRAARSPVLWFFLAYTLLAHVVIFWAVLDNHIYLLSYWSVALFCGLALQDSRQAIATSARWLVGLTFLFAVVWKALLSPDFLSGDFMRHTLLMDARFREFALLFGDITREQFSVNRGLIADWQNAGTGTVTLFEPPGQAFLGRVSTWLALVVEGLVALCFLWSRGGFLSRIRHGVLLLFAWITYPFATVFGFGWLLMVLGIAQCEPERRVVRLLYLLTFLVIFFHQFVPWTTALTGSR